MRTAAALAIAAAALATGCGTPQRELGPHL